MRWIGIIGALVAVAAAAGATAGLVRATPDSATVSASGPYATAFDMRCSDASGTYSCVIQNVSLGELVNIAIDAYPAIAAHAHDTAHEHPDLATAIGGLDDRQRVRIGELVDLRTAIQTAVRIGGQGREHARTNAAALDALAARVDANAADVLAFEGAADDHQHDHQHQYASAYAHLRSIDGPLVWTGRTEPDATHYAIARGYHITPGTYRLDIATERDAGSRHDSVLLVSVVVDDGELVSVASAQALITTAPHSASRTFTLVGAGRDGRHHNEGELRLNLARNGRGLGTYTVTLTPVE